MKFIFTFLFAAISAATVAQWSDTRNQFYDSLHMSVCTQANDQLENFVVQSFPDSGYFLVWQDHRSNIYNTQIFAQKFDKHGNQLWATDGVPISSGTNNQHFTYSSNSDERNYSYAATDSAGGFYIAYADDSISTYVWERATVQHIKNSGTGVFSGAGYIVATSNTANEHVSTQLIADGNKGFFIGLIKAANLYVFCFKDINGTMQYYGGSNGILNNNVVLNYNTGQCGNYTTAYYPATNVTDYKIYPDLQNGCNVVMTIGQNTGGNERTITGLNWLWRVKNNTTANSTFYKKDSVIQYYNLMVSHSTLTCGSGATAYAYPTDAIVSNGFASLNNLAYGAEHVKGTIVPTDGNINANIVATNQRDLINNNQVTTWFTKVICRPQEKFNDIPYAYTVDPFVPSTLTGGPYPGQNKLGTYTGLNNDTLLYDPSGSYYYEFCLASGGNKIYSSAPIGNGGARNILLQGLQIDRVTSDSFALRSNTNNKMGVVIGKESYYMSYNQPQIAVNNIGSAIFYITVNRANQVSPIINGSELAWGAMGKRTGSGLFAGHYYSPNNPFIALDPVSGSGLLSWYDDRVPPSTGNNIFMRHLDSLDIDGYGPPHKMVKQLINNYGSTPADYTVLLGSSHHYTTIEASNGLTSSPVVEILDNYNLGNVAVSVYENLGAIRTYNGKPYLDRNYTIIPDNNPNGAATVNVRLFFTQAEFDALKAVIPSINNPGDLSVIKQPATGSAPASYSFIPGEKQVYPQSWAAVPGGYYIEIAITSFSNFFIQSPTAALPLTWLGVQAQWQNASEAKVSWQVATQQNIAKYVVQVSAGDNNFEDACSTNATAQTQYACIANSPYNKNYFRVKEIDIDGRISYSNVILLEKSSLQSLTISPNPAHNVIHVNGLQNYMSYQLLDIRGKIIRQKIILPASKDINIDNLSAGAYFLRLTGKSDSKTFKFIKE